MKFFEYQKNAKKTFKKHKASEITNLQLELLDWATGIGGESGEVIELIKHHVFSQEPLDKMKLAKELGDILWYVSAIASSLDISIEDVLKLNQAKLQHRYTQNNVLNYNHNASANRHVKEEEFKDTQVFKDLCQSINYRMTFVFIGPDGAGKTTISKMLAKDLGIEYQKNDHSQENKVDCLHDFISELSLKSKVADRLWVPDNTIYSDALHFEENEEDIIHWEEELLKLKGQKIMFIYLYRPMEELITILLDRGDEYLEVEPGDNSSSNISMLLHYFEGIFKGYTEFIGLLNKFNIPCLEVRAFDKVENTYENMMSRIRLVQATNKNKIHYLPENIYLKGVGKNE